MKNLIERQLPPDFPWQIHWFDTIDSTSTYAKSLAAAGAPHGTVVMADHQTGGRGRRGRSFSSPPGAGIYLSVILRPDCPPDQLMHLTCAVGVAMCNAIYDSCGLEPGIKWVNDLIWNKRKLGGILTELSLNSKTGFVDYAVIGIGINCTQQPEDFPESIRSIAISLKTATQAIVDRPLLAANMLRRLYETDQSLLAGKTRFMEQYRQRCVTLGQAVRVMDLQGQAIGLDDAGALLIRTENGDLIRVDSGEVSVRGLYDYL